MSCPRPLFCRHGPLLPPLARLPLPLSLPLRLGEISCCMRLGGWQTARDRARLTLGIRDGVGWAILRCTTVVVRGSGMLCNQLTASRSTGLLTSPYDTTTLGLSAHLAPSLLTCLSHIGMLANSLLLLFRFRADEQKWMAAVQQIGAR